MALRNRQPVMAMGSNDYLGLMNHPKVTEAAVDAVRRYGTGCSGSRFLNGTLALHEELEERLAAFLHKEATIVFPSEYQAILGAISAVAGKNETVVIDTMSHPGIVDACRLSFAQVQLYRHNDMRDLERILRASTSRRVMVVAEGVYGICGDIADLPGLQDLCHRYQAGLMIDEAHAFGVLGGRGRGTGDHFGVDNAANVVMVGFGNSLATTGGCLAADGDIIDFLKHHARPLIFSASLPPSAVAAATTALQIMQEEPERLVRLRRNSEYLREGLRTLGFEVGTAQIPLISVVVGDDMRAMALAHRLHAAGVQASPVLSPLVPCGKAFVRVTSAAGPTLSRIDEVLDVFASAVQTMGLLD